MRSPTPSEVSIIRVPAPTSVSSLRTASVPPPPNTLPEPRSNSSHSATSLEFGDGDTKHGMVLAPATVRILSSEMNGTTRHFLIDCLKSPRKTAGGAFEFLHRRTRSLDWLKELGETVSARVGEGLNRAFEGKDAVEFVNSAVAMVPTISVPSMRTVSQTVDNLADKLQKLDMRKPAIIEMPDTQFQGCEWAFASDMGHKAENALVKQRICERRHVMEGHRNAGWQMELTQALANTYIRFRGAYSLGELLSMKPLWIPVRDEGVWRLVLETSWVAVDTGSGISSPTQQLETDFAMPALYGWLSVKDSCRDSLTVEGGEWEAVEA